MFSRFRTTFTTPYKYLTLYRRMSVSPVIVGHRGFKGNYPENTMIGFNKCFETGATIIETDLWLAKDNVIIISHDPSTKRVFVDSEGNETDYKIIDTEYDPILKQLKTIEGGYPLMTFREVLQWFKAYVVDHEGEFKLQLDIKRFNPPKILKQIIEDLLSVEPNMGFWYNRIQFGIWDLNFLKYLNQDDYFQDKFAEQQFDIFNITVSWRDAIFYVSYNDYLDALGGDRVKIKLTGVSLIYISTWSQGFLTKFVPLLKVHGLKLFSWTINKKFQYEYLCKVGELGGLVEYGVISDHPDTMVSYADHKEELEEVGETTRLTPTTESLRSSLTFKQWFSYFIFQVFHKMGSDKKLTDDEKQYDSIVDENKVRVIKVNEWVIWMFQTMQKFGIF
ncbi:uncharacterized protein SPAPADRAFT_63287, partial [Spathaspora passalidarum NRRL Y-27907]